MTHPRRIRLPRKIHAGSLPVERPGETLRCLVLARGSEEWIGVDLESGAFVRVPGGIDAPIDDTVHETPAVEFTIVPRVGTVDPSRPELVLPATVPVVIGSPRVRSVRKFLGRLATPEASGSTILGTRGPSIAYIDLDGNGASVQLLPISVKKLGLEVNEREEPMCSIPWGGTTQRTRVVDGVAARAALASAPRALSGPQIATAIGYRPSFVLVGLGRVSGGHAPKVVLALL